MSTPYPPGSNTPGYLRRTDEALIQTPGWISSLPDQASRPFSSECFKEGYLTGWANSSDQYTGAKVLVAVRYILEKKGATPQETADVLNALEGSLPARLQ